MTIYTQLRDRIRAEEPVALATVIDGPARGAKLLVGPGAPIAGTLGDPDLDRVGGRDGLLGADAVAQLLVDRRHRRATSRAAR